MEEDPKSQRISGSGKSHIAIGLGLAACEKGLSVGFITAASLVHELIEAHDDKRLLRLQRQLAGHKLSNRFQQRPPFHVQSRL